MTAPNEVHDLMPAESWHTYVDGWCNGWSAGLDEGRRRADVEAAARHRVAADVVLAMAKLPVVDQAESAARRARVDARFTGEGGA